MESTLRSRKRVEQEKGQDSDETFAVTWKNWKAPQSLESEENKKTETEDEQDNWKQYTEIDNSKFEVDLRISGISDDAVRQDENHMKEINEKLEKIKNRI